MKQRINKYLADSGLCSRRKCDELIKKGLIKINQKTAVLGDQIDVQKDEIVFKGRIIKPVKKHVYIALNKPEGYLSSCKRTNRKEKIVLDLVKIKRRVYPIGRLDKNSRGLILLTDDGDLTNKLMHPRYEKQKQYDVKVHKEINDRFINKMKSGVKIDGYKTQPTEIKQLNKKKFSIILKEGKKRQIRKMCSKLGYEVIDLKRTKIGNIELNDLKPGQWKYIKKTQI